jgi:hypothetical protein
MTELTQERLKQVLSYNPDTGEFVCLVSRRRARAGSIAGRIRPDGYRAISIDDRDHLAHRTSRTDWRGFTCLVLGRTKKSIIGTGIGPITVGAIYVRQPPRKIGQTQAFGAEADRASRGSGCMGSDIRLN